MDAANSSLELLAHFDRPAATETAWKTPIRGVGWVLRWSAAIAILFFAACVLAQFAYCLATERALARAARAGALEATLPRATYESVRQSIARRLGDFPQRPSSRLRFSLLQNGTPARGLILAGEGDRISVALSLPTHDALPQWLGKVSFWRGDSSIEVHAERMKPGRQLPRR